MPRTRFAANDISDLFVGRAGELEHIEQRINQVNMPCLILVEGSGGVGKTRVMRKVHDICSGFPEIFVFPVVDFSQNKTRTIPWLMDFIVEAARHMLLERGIELPVDVFGAYLDLRQTPAYGENTPNMPEHLPEEYEEAFCCGLNALEKLGRCVFLFDTLELIQGTLLLEFVLGMFRAAQNSVIVLAGRRAPGLKETLQKLEAHGPVSFIDLVGLHQQDALQYIQLHPSGQRLSHEEQLALYQLADEGIPIKLAMALGWLSRGLVMHTLVENPYKHLIALKATSPKEFERVKLQFERELVIQIAELGTDVDQVLKLMGHVNKRFNRAILHQLAPEADTEGVVTQLKTLGFVKVIEDDYFVLHDEIQRMVVRHAWESSDPTGEVRREISHKVIQYYDGQLEQLKRELSVAKVTSPAMLLDYQVYEIERLYYQLDVDLTSGYRAFTELFRELQEQRNIDAAALVLDVLLTDRSLPPRLRDFVETYYRGWVLVRRLALANARTLLENRVKRLTPIAVRTTAAPGTEFLYREVDQRLGEVYTLLGYCCRLMGDWEQALEYYDEGRKRIEHAIDEVSALVSTENADLHALLQRSKLGLAEALNDIANLHRMKGELEGARRYCKVGLLLREKLGAVRQAGNSCYVMGMILWESGNTVEAMRYLERARTYYRQTGMTNLERAWIDRYEGYVMYRSGHITEGSRLLALAQSAAAHNPALRDEYAEILLLQSRIKLDEGNDEALGQALEQANEALTLARQTNNEYRIAEAHLTLARIARAVLGRRGGDPALQQQFLADMSAGAEIATRRHYRRLEVVFATIEGDLAFDRQDYVAAFDRYLQACLLGIEFKPAVFSRAASRLADRLYELIKHDSTNAIGVAERLLTWIGRHDILKERYPELQIEMRYALDVANSVRAWELNQRRFYSDLRKGSWEDAIAYCDIADSLVVHQHPNHAAAFQQRAEVYYEESRFALARIYCERAVRIRSEHTPNSTALGDSLFLLGRINWRQANTAEAAAYLELAEQQYLRQPSTHGKALIALERGYLAFRELKFDAAASYLQHARTEFARLGDGVNEARALNVLSWMTRTAAATQAEDWAIHYREAENWATDALAILGDQDVFVAIELSLTLCILHFAWGKRLQAAGQTTDAATHLEMAWQNNRAGLAKLATLNAPMLHSVYYGMEGNLFAQAGDFERARKSYLEELRYAAETKHMRLIISLDLLENWLMDIPLEATETHGRWMVDKWRQDSHTNKHPEVQKAIEWILEHRRFV